MLAQLICWRISWPVFPCDRNIRPYGKAKREIENGYRFSILHSLFSLHFFVDLVLLSVFLPAGDEFLSLTAGRTGGFLKRVHGRNGLAKR